MKKTISIITAALCLIACDRHVAFTNLPFVYFNTSSISVYEDAGEVKIPVCAKADVAFNLSFETVNGQKKDSGTGQMVPNGQAGVDYDILENEAKVIHFNAGQQSDTIRVSITDFPGILTGNKDFTIRILNAGTEVSLGGFSTCKVTILDNDHPLKEVFGEYAATDGEGTSWTVTLAEDPNSFTQVFFDGIVPTFAGAYVSTGKRYYVPCQVTEDLSKITVPLGYTLADTNMDESIMIGGYAGGSSFSLSGTVTFSKTDTGYKLDGNRGFIAIYEDEGEYWLAASDAIVSAPITLVKK